jgi:translation initiation factor IF-2
MASGRPPELPARWATWLASQSETGMGYQVVDVVLNDGRIVKDVAIVEAHMVAEVRGHPDVPFDPSEIAEVRLTHNRWVFRR